MLEHHIQKYVLTQLIERETARYADLKPADMDGNTFTYHLRALQRQKLIAKTDNGMYELTRKGKLYGVNHSLKSDELLAQAHPIILIVVRDGERWLLRKRLVQPLFGKTGFIHGEPAEGLSLQEAAARTLLRRTGLTATFTVKGSGFIRVQQIGETLAYSAFTLVEAHQTSGTLKAEDSHGQNLWMTRPDFTSDSMIPSMPDLVRHLESPGLFFADLRYDAK